MTPVDYFAEADAAMDAFNVCETVDSEEEDEWGISVVYNNFMTAMARTCRLPDGDLHYCDQYCAFTKMSTDGNNVCELTSNVVSRICVERTDNSTGRSTWSVDPDVNAGGPMGGAWRKKRDMFKASATAHNQAYTLDDSEMPKAIEAVKVLRSSAKRGALCVDEQAPDDTGPKRVRISKKNVASQSTRVMLMEDALSTFSKMIVKQARKIEPKTTIDPRLLNKDLLYQAAVKKYIKDVSSRGEAPTMDDLSNIELAVIEVVNKEKEKHRVALTSEGRVHSMAFKSAVARLAVALWSGVRTVRLEPTLLFPSMHFEPIRTLLNTACTHEHTLP
jgi:hypothetical protein